MRAALSFVIALVMLSPCGPAQAWGKIGHRVTGAVADVHLSGEARAAVEALLGPEDLAEASTWPDFMRSSDAEFWRRTAGPFHYVTVPGGQRYADVGAPPQGDAVSALAQFRATLRDPDASLEDKQLALRFAVHIIGDLHQPLHAGNGTDRGGNDMVVTFFGELTNLHSVWDTALVNHQELSYTEMTTWLVRRQTPAQIRDWWTDDPTVWIAESTVLRDQLYPPADGDRELRWDYVYAHRDTVRLRLSQAGVRMAAWLSATFADEGEAP